MKKTAIFAGLAIAFGVAIAAPASVQAANARHPYQNVNKANDQGNPTGDSRTDQLNAQSLAQARGGNGGAMGAPNAPMMRQ